MDRATRRLIAAGAAALLGLMRPGIAPAQSTGPIPAPIGRSPVPVELKTLRTGVLAPVLLVGAGDGGGRRFVVEQPGTVRIIDAGGNQLSTPFLDVSSRLVPFRPGFDERGLLGLAFHPGFADPTSLGFRKVYTFTSEPINTGVADFRAPNIAPADVNAHSVVSEWTVDAANPNVVDPASRREIMRIEKPQFNHNGGMVAFGPDEHLYISLGDGGGANDLAPDGSLTGHSAQGNGQDVTNILGKVVRIDPLSPSVTDGGRGTPSANGQYRIPDNNPFVGRDGLDEIFAHGLRNPYRFSFDAHNPADLIIADVGQNNIEEIDRIDVNEVLDPNFGWPLKEGSFLFNRDDGTIEVGDVAGVIDPVAEYDHDEGISIIGGFMYRGPGIPDLEGRYIFGDFLGRVFEADLDTSLIRLLAVLPDGMTIRGFGQDDRNELYVLAADGFGPDAPGTIFQLAAVPEPSSVVLFGLGAAILLGYSRRHRRSARA